MSDTFFFNLLLNFGLLVLIATMLTMLPVVRSMLFEDKHSIGSHVALSLVFGLISICSTYTGVKTQGAIVNTRVISVLAAGLLNGPYVGIGTALIGGLHRYLFDIGGFTSISCSVSTLVEGLIGVAFSKRFKDGKINRTGIFAICALAEICQMFIILLLARPFSAAVELVSQIALPMIVMNSLGLVIFIEVFNVAFRNEDSLLGEQMKIALKIAEESLPHWRKGLQSTSDMVETAKIIYDSIPCAAVAITDTKQLLALWGGVRYSLLRNPALLQEIFDSIQNQKAAIFSHAESTDSMYPLLKNNILVAAPLMEMDQFTGSLIIVEKKRWQVFESKLIFVSELARLFSSQLELSNLDYQKQLTRKAEFLALRSQVNPHFLYNALNTISFVCRENPTRARELILSLSSYYRQTLENNQYILSLTTELSHVMGYLTLEQARFEERLIVRSDIEPDLNCMLPSFVLQPLVENAVQYGIDSSGNRYVAIHAHRDGELIRISVRDHGPGIPQEVIHNLETDSGNGIGMYNVQQRLKSIYGASGGLRIDSSDSGTTVSFLIPPIPTGTLPFTAPSAIQSEETVPGGMRASDTERHGNSYENCSY